MRFIALKTLVISGLLALIGSSLQPAKNSQFVEVISKRSQTGKVFQNTQNPNKFIFQGGLAPLHYQSNLDDANSSKQIDLTPQVINTTTFDGWQITDNGWHFSLGKDRQKDEDGWVGFGGLEGEKWLRYRLIDMSLYHPDSDSLLPLTENAQYQRDFLALDVNYVNFSANQERVAAGLQISWSNLWPEFGADQVLMKLEADGHGLKEEIIIAEAARKKLFSQNLANSKSDNNYFGFTFELDLNDVSKIYREGVEARLNDEFVSQGEAVELYDELDRLIAFMPVDDLIIKKDGEEIDRRQLLKKIYRRNNKIYLFIGEKLSLLKQLPPGKLVFDPTLNLQVNTGDSDSTQSSSGSNTPTVDTFHVRALASDYRYGAARWQITGPNQGDTIDNAWFEGYFTHASRDDIHAKVFAEAVNNAPQFTNAVNHITTRKANGTTAFYEWQFVGTGIGWYSTGSGSLKAVVQEVIDRPGWVSGNYLALFFDPSPYNSGEFAWIGTYETGSTLASKLNIEYTAGGGGSPNVSQSVFRWRNDTAGINADSGWLDNEDVAYTNLEKEQIIRLRLAIENSGTAADDYQYLLEYAEKNGGSCGDNETFISLPATATTQHFEMVNSSQFTDGDTVSSSWLGGSGSFVNGEAVEYPSTKTGELTIASSSYTEIEYALKANSNSINSTPYCFRVTNDGDALDNYDIYAEVTTAANNTPLSPQVPHVNNDTAQSGQVSPVTGLIDPTPAFSAIFDDPDEDDLATHYQIQVGSNASWDVAEMWDSTQTAMADCDNGNRCQDIIYNGSTLVDSGTYYWRIRFWDNGGLAGSWSENQVFTMNKIPSVVGVVLNENEHINLTANSTTTVQWTALIVDQDGYGNIDEVVGKVYRSGVSGAEACTPNDANCYEDLSCALSSCAGNSCEAVCSVEMEFFADPTDSTSPYSSEHWRAWIQATDLPGVSGVNFSQVNTVKVSSLVAMDIDESISYGAYAAGENSGTNNSTTTVVNIGNTSLDAEVSGTNMCADYPTCSGSQIAVEQQKYHSSSFTYGSGGTALLGTSATLTLGLPKSTTTPANSSANIYWGIGIPLDLAIGVYTGENTVVAENAD